jgi:hypothetical protein
MMRSSPGWKNPVANRTNAYVITVSAPRTIRPTMAGTFAGAHHMAQSAPARPAPAIRSSRPHSYEIG